MNVRKIWTKFRFWTEFLNLSSVPLPVRRSNGQTGAKAGYLRGKVPSSFFHTGFDSTANPTAATSTAVTNAMIISAISHESIFFGLAGRKRGVGVGVEESVQSSVFRGVRVKSEHR